MGKSTENIAKAISELKKDCAALEAQSTHTQMLAIAARQARGEKGLQQEYQNLFKRHKAALKALKKIQKSTSTSQPKILA